MLTWRRFSALLGAMSGNSLFFATIREENKNKPVENTDDIMQDIARQLGGRKG